MAKQINLTEAAETTALLSATNNSKKSKKHTKTEIAKNIPRGMPKSGRSWKTPKKRFSSIIKTKGIRNSFEKKQLLQNELKQIKEASRAIITAKQEAKELKKEKRRENLKRQEENRKKSEIVQVIKNPAKIKKMKKKQLRLIEKRAID